MTEPLSSPFFFFFLSGFKSGFCNFPFPPRGDREGTGNGLRSFFFSPFSFSFPLCKPLPFLDGRRAEWLSFPPPPPPFPPTAGPFLLSFRRHGCRGSSGTVVFSFCAFLIFLPKRENCLPFFSPPFFSPGFYGLPEGARAIFT